MGAQGAGTRGGAGLLPRRLLLLLLLPALLTLSPEAAQTPEPLGSSPWKAPGEKEGTSRVQKAASGPEDWASGAQVCGKTKAVGKVYGGQDTEAGQWPWQASLLYRGSHLCGAVLIDSHWLVSTAHCFRNKSKALEDYQVLLGNTQLYQQTQHTQKISVSRIITHPDFEKFHPFGSDIAMLQLYLPVKFSSYVIPACLPHPDMQLLSPTSCWITGWGMLTEDSELSPPFPLQEAEVGLIENELCSLLYEQRTGKDHLVQEEMLCIGNFSEGKSICSGDSGGPLVCYYPGAWVLVGLASWSLDCRHPVYPSVFTRVTHFTDWISSVKRLTPVPDSLTGPPPTHFLPQPLRATGFRKSHSVLGPAQTCLLLPFMLQAAQHARGTPTHKDLTKAKEHVFGMSLPVGSSLAVPIFSQGTTTELQVMGDQLKVEELFLEDPVEDPHIFKPLPF
ncbi:putative serine protease 47 [Octodon degus]|uniref:Serine protease 47 n=1 Tax=Octodon degus TaxID=10160 RepID=A0A6P6F4M5_OCTDE|nr:putative serine protease 47 [Octodon degus]